MPEIYEENNIVIILNYDAKQFKKMEMAYSSKEKVFRTNPRQGETEA